MRNNSVFWLASGYSLDFGLTGGVVKTGTFNQFIRGGIAFATPPGTPLAPKAREGKHFLLQESEPKSGVNGELRFPNIAHCSGVPAPERLSKLRACFASGICSWPNTPFISDAFLTQMREAMPSTLSFDDFLAACQRPLRRSIPR